MKRQDEAMGRFLVLASRTGAVRGGGPCPDNRFLKHLARQERVFPNGVRKRPSLSTLRRKLRQYRREGFDALARKGRA